MIRPLCRPLYLVVVVAIVMLVILVISKDDNPNSSPSLNGSKYPSPIALEVPIFPQSVVEPNPSLDCASSPVIKTIYYPQRDPFKDPYYPRPLEDVLREMSDYPGGPGRKPHHLKQQLLMTKFAWKIMDRDKNNPERLQYPMHLNEELLNMTSDRQPFFSFWNSGLFNSTKGVVSDLAFINLAQSKQMEVMHPDWAKFKYVALDDSVLSDYLTFPPHVIARKGKNYTITYFSDMLRVNAICEYGGFWADSSFFWDQPMPREVYDADFFAFKIWQTPAWTSSWFLHAKPHSPVFLWVRHIMFEYWRDHNSHQYYDFHLTLEIVLQMLPELKPYYSTMPFYSSRYAHSLHNIMGKEFSEKRYQAERAKGWGFKLSNHPKNITFRHKITERAMQAKQWLQEHP